ncbi:extracellular solute-binding protein [Neobacillus kokaensis]|uniref:Sugar ABC transporter substrate-binding protein n=1 Tax=Neobacillus kokaensis TaxID=2759023 RepID=A0ABQ3N1Y6_9BACI|nr:extracellular solute-binding protein [Neobacillus kokaensis]GHH97875.1 sugar ABC transporter substrate-binding protein [Neobacillus kokaensis]
MKRKFNVLLSLVTAMLMLLVGCSDSASNTKKETKPAKDIVTEAGTFPIVKKKETLTVLTHSNTGVKDFKTNEFTKWYEEKTGVHIKWEVLPEEGAMEKLNLMLASGEYPDVIMDMGLKPAQLRVYGEKGVFLKLNDLIEKYGVQTKKMFNEMPLVEDAVKTPDGHIYALPQVNECFHCTTSQKMWIYKPWLDKLGLDVPTTTEEFYNVMTAFKTQDPNGNGKADEIPLSGMKSYWHEEIAGFLMNPFIYSDKYIEDGKIVVPWDKPEWRDGLKYLNKMYKAGLIYSGSFTQDPDQFKKLGENPDIPILGAAASSVPSFFVDVSDKGRAKDYIAVPPLKGPNGQQITLYEPSPVTRPAEFIITNKAKHPDVAFRWADAMYDQEITINSVFGMGQFMDAKDGEVGLDGKPAKWTLKEQDPNNVNNNISWNQTGPSLRTNEFRAGQAVPEGDQEQLLWKATEQHVPYISKTIQPVPRLFFSEEDSNKLATLEQSIDNYIDEMTASFITGKTKLNDKSWKEYIKNLEGAGIKDYLQIYQNAYNEKYKK